MDLVVDIQCLIGNNQITIPKEIAVRSINNNFSAHWIITPSSSTHILNQSAKKQNDWLTRNLHGINYFDGEACFKDVCKILRNIVKNVRNIYVRGNQKWLLLHKIINQDIINLEYDKECPSFHNLSANTYCLHHAVKPDSKRYRCALNNVF